MTRFLSGCTRGGLIGPAPSSCPSSLIYFEVGEMIARFMAECPKVEVLLESTNRRVDVIREGFDLAIRVRFGGPRLSSRVGDSRYKNVVAGRVGNELFPARNVQV